MAFRLRSPIRCQALWIVLLGNCNPPVIPSKLSAVTVAPPAVLPAPEFQYHRIATHAGQHLKAWKKSGGASSGFTVACDLDYARGAKWEVVETGREINT